MNKLYKIFSISIYMIFFLLAGSGLKAQYYIAGWSYSGDIAIDAFGWSMSAGDVNGDGYDDLLISAIDHSEPIEAQEEEGKLYLFYGSASGLSSTPAWTYQANVPLNITGFSTDIGDLNGDGYSDIVVGCIQYTGTIDEQGRVLLFYGSASGLSSSPDWQYYGDQEHGLMGSGVAMSGDINNDGFKDLFVSAKMYSNPEINEGKVWMFWGSADGPVGPVWSYESNQEGAIAGFPVQYAGDVNADGYDDVIIGINAYDQINIDDGKAVCFYGSPTGLTTTPQWSVSSGQKKSFFGHWVAGAGDVNGDGYDDVLVSAILYENDSLQFNEGWVFAYYGSATGLNTGYDWSSQGEQTEANFGYSVAGAGDIDNDGYDDVIIGAKYWNGGQISEGGGFVFFGSSSGLETQRCWHEEGNQDSAYYGKNVGGNGDFNGDGYADFFAGAYRYTNILTQDGIGYVYYGGPREADFHYADDTFCIENSDPVPVIDGLPGGIYTGSAGVVIDSVTGIIDLSLTGFGNFTVSRTVESYCTVTRSTAITIIFPPDGSFSYPADTFSITGPDPFPNFAPGAISGTFTASPPGLVFIDVSTGQIDVSSSTPNTYSVYNTATDGFCVITDTAIITVQPPCEKPQNIIVSDISTNSATLIWNSVEYAATYMIYLFSSTDTTVFTDYPDTTLTFTSLIPGEQYRAWVIANCTGKNSPKSDNADFSTLLNGIDEANTSAMFSVFPNPASNNIQVNIEQKNLYDDVTFRIKNIEGKTVKAGNIAQSAENFIIPLYNFSDGIYFIQFIYGAHIYTKKITVIKN